MFEKAIITRAGVDREADLGLLAETIFFYQSVQLVLSHTSITALATKIPIDDLIALLNRTELKLSYVRPNFGVISSGQPRVHQFNAFTFSGSQERKATNYEDELAIFLERKFGNTPKTHKLIKAITKRTVLHKFRESPRKERIVPDLAREDASDKEFIRMAAGIVLKALLPTYTSPPNFKFELFDTGQGYAIDTNIDFAALNKLYHLRVPPSHSSLSPEYILAHIIAARAETYFASNYMGEIVTSPVYSEIIRLKHFDFLRRREANAAQIDLFHEISLADAPSLREAVNSGACTISEYLRLLDKAQRFKMWLQDANIDSGLVSSYYKAATEKTWADKLPTKSIRFIIASGLGALADLAMPTGIGTAAGVGVGLLDSFYLDNLIKGWRPNQFIEGPYKNFLTGDKGKQP